MVDVSHMGIAAKKGILKHGCFTSLAWQDRQSLFFTFFLIEW